MKNFRCTDRWSDRGTAYCMNRFQSTSSLTFDVILIEFHDPTRVLTWKELHWFYLLKELTVDHSCRDSYLSQKYF